MTDTLPRRAPSHGGESAGYRVTDVRDRRWLEERLSDDRAFSAYAIGYLEDEVFEFTRFWHAEGPAGDALVMQARQLGAVTVVTGAPAAIAAVLAIHPGPPLGYLSTAAPAHEPALGTAYRVNHPLHMRRMTLSAISFERVEGAVTRLRGFHAPQVNALYASGGGPSNYPPDAIERAVYFGIIEDGELVAVAGTHVVAPRYGIAVVGNVFTHPAHRGRGYAQRVTSAVSEELFHRGCAEVVLTVDPENTPAVFAYSRLGYQPSTPVLEARLQRRDLLGIGPALRRWTARRRGRALGEGIEVVPSPLDHI